MLQTNNVRPVPVITVFHPAEVMKSAPFKTGNNNDPLAIPEMKTVVVFKCNDPRKMCIYINRHFFNIYIYIYMPEGKSLPFPYANLPIVCVKPCSRPRTLGVAAPPGNATFYQASRRGVIFPTREARMNSKTAYYGKIPPFAIYCHATYKVLFLTLP